MLCGHYRGGDPVGSVCWCSESDRCPCGATLGGTLRRDTGRVTDRNAPADPGLVAALANFARGVVGCAGSPVVLSHRTGELVLRCGTVVVKGHAPGTDRDMLNARLDIVESPRFREVLLAPLARGEVDGRPVTGGRPGRRCAPTTRSTPHGTSPARSLPACTPSSRRGRRRRPVDRPVLPGRCTGSLPARRGPGRGPGQSRRRTRRCQPGPAASARSRGPY